MATTSEAEVSRPEESERLVAWRDFGMREPLSTDVHFIRDSWRRSYERSRFARTPDLGSWMYASRRAISEAIDTSRLVVAYDLEDERRILGWVCARPPSILHYVFVKDLQGTARGRGVGRALLNELLPPWPDSHTGFLTFLHPLFVHRGEAGDWRFLGRQWRFSPLLIFGETKGDQP